jgi:integrase
MVSIKPKGKRWRIEIYFRWPDGVPYRKRLLAPVTAKSAAMRWGQQYEANALAQGREALKSPPAEGGLPPRPAEPVEQYARRWLDEREGRVHSIRDDRSRMRLHVLPTLGPLDTRTFTRDDIEHVRDELDEKITDGTLAWKTAASCWTLVTSMCADMVTAKKRELRTRDDNPCRDVKPPERGARKAKQYLYPSEFLQFVSCESIPLRWRRAVTLAIYTYARDGELRVLQWNDLEHGVINIIRAYNRRKPGEIKGTKSDAPRRFAVEPNLRPLLDAMRQESGANGLVVELASERAMARNFRRWLWKAGVRRAALHETTDQSQNITWHDLRATGATWMAVRGDDPLKIMQRCGHRDYGTTLRYIREAEAVRDGFGEPFPTLPPCLLESPRQPSRGTLVARAASDDENIAFSRAI